MSNNNTSLEQIFEMCRFCGKINLDKAGLLICLFQPKEHHIVIQDIKNELNECWIIEISEEDGLPHHVCQACFSEFDGYFSFRKTCLKKQNAIKMHYTKLTKDVSAKQKTLRSKHTAFALSQKGLPTTRKMLCKKYASEKMSESTSTTDNDGNKEECEESKYIEFIEIPISSHKKFEQLNIKREDESIVLHTINDLQCYEKEYSSGEENNDPIANTSGEDDEDQVYQRHIITYKTLKKNTLSCKYCCFDNEILSPSDVIFSSKDELDEHIKQHNMEKPYTCPICKKTHKTLKLCRWHILYMHKKKPAICQTCGKVCPLHLLRKHEKKCHIIADYQCETCGKKFENCALAKFEYHQRWHNKQKQYKCKLCEKVFVQGGHLKAHMIIHTKEYQVNCKNCGKGFKSQYDKGLHMTRVHGEAKPVKCLYCDERFLLYTRRNNHMIQNHGYIPKNINERVQCLKCNKVYKRETGLRTHEAKGCQGIELTTAKKIFKKSEKNYECKNCSHKFGKESALIKHLPLHSAKGRPFQCDVCQLHYKTHSHLEIHKSLIHGTEKPFVCDICGKRFAVKFVLTAHKKSHKENRTKIEKLVGS